MIAAVVFVIFGHACWMQKSVLFHGSSHEFYSLDVERFPSIIDRLSNMIDAGIITPLDADSQDHVLTYCHMCHTTLALVIAAAQGGD
jgi:hypothetical protein